MSLMKRRTMTEKRITASRKNGQRSRGARTPEGRSRAAAANLRHGFYSEALSDVLVALGEDPERFEQLVDGLTEIWQPANQMEMRLVMRLACALWRMERADRIQESLTVEQLHRSIPKPTFLQVIDQAIKAKAYRLASLTAEVCRAGHFTSPEDFEIFENVFGPGPDEPGSDELAIRVSLERLVKPGTEDAGPVIDGSDPQAVGTLPEDEEARDQERHNLSRLLIRQLANVEGKRRDGDEGPANAVYSRYAWDSLMAPRIATTPSCSCKGGKMPTCGRSCV